MLDQKHTGAYSAFLGGMRHKEDALGGKATGLSNELHILLR